MVVMMVAAMVVVMSMVVLMIMLGVVMTMIVASFVMMGVTVGMTMIMRVAVIVAMAGIGAAHRLEGGHDVDHLGTQTLQHRLDDMVAQDEDAISRYGSGEMAVADVPGELRQVGGVAGADVVELLLGGDDACRAAVFQQQEVAGFENDRLGQVDKHAFAPRQRDGAAPDVALVMGEDGDVEGLRAGGGIGMGDLGCAQHEAFVPVA